MNRTMRLVVLLTASNIFMTFGWYWHLKHKHWPLWLAIVLSWLIALPEYCLQVPANRGAHIDFGGDLRAPQLKIMQEAITLVVFSVFSMLVLKEQIRWNDAAAFALIFAAIVVSVLW